MTHLINQYAEAVMTLLIDGMAVAEVVSGLKRTLNRRKHDALLLLILKRVQRELPVRLREQRPQVRVVSEQAATALHTSIEAELKALEAPSEYDVTYDDSLVGGYVIQYQSTRVDNSYKHILKHLYHNIITS